MSDNLFLKFFGILTLESKETVVFGLDWQKLNRNVFWDVIQLIYKKGRNWEFVRMAGRAKMYLIAGLGNPTYQYARTRHNIGFEVIDELADRNGISMDINKHKGVCGKGLIAGEKVILLQPQTYMNLSGESIREAVGYYKLDPQKDLILIFDDISLDVGQIRLRAKGSAGGHNGVKSVIACLGTDVFFRVKVGVGEKPKGWDLADYVLGRFGEEERIRADESVERAALAAECILLSLIHI